MASTSYTGPSCASDIRRARAARFSVSLLQDFVSPSFSLGLEKLGQQPTSERCSRADLSGRSDGQNFKRRRVAGDMQSPSFSLGFEIPPPPSFDGSPEVDRLQGRDEGQILRRQEESKGGLCSAFHLEEIRSPPSFDRCSDIRPSEGRKKDDALSVYRRVSLLEPLTLISTDVVEESNVFESKTESKRVFSDTKTGLFTIDEGKVLKRRKKISLDCEELLAVKSEPMSFVELDLNRCLPGTTRADGERKVGSPVPDQIAELMQVDQVECEDLLSETDFQLASECDVFTNDMEDSNPNAVRLESEGVANRKQGGSHSTGDRNQLQRVKRKSLASEAVPQVKLEPVFTGNLEDLKSTVCQRENRRASSGRKGVSPSVNHRREPKQLMREISIDVQPQHLTLSNDLQDSDPSDSQINSARVASVLSEAVPQLKQESVFKDSLEGLNGNGSQPVSLRAVGRRKDGSPARNQNRGLMHSERGCLVSGTDSQEGSGSKFFANNVEDLNANAFRKDRVGLDCRRNVRSRSVCGRGVLKRLKCYSLGSRPVFVKPDPSALEDDLEDTNLNVLQKDSRIVASERECASLLQTGVLTRTKCGSLSAIKEPFKCDVDLQPGTNIREGRLDRDINLNCDVFQESWKVEHNHGSFRVGKQVLPSVDDGRKEVYEHVKDDYVADYDDIEEFSSEDEPFELGNHENHRSLRSHNFPYSLSMPRDELLKKPVLHIPGLDLQSNLSNVAKKKIFPRLDAIILSDEDEVQVQSQMRQSANGFEFAFKEVSKAGSTSQKRFSNYVRGESRRNMNTASQLEWMRKGKALGSDQSNAWNSYEQTFDQEDTVWASDMYKSAHASNDVYRMCQSDDSRVAAFLRERLPHFKPVDALLLDGGLDQEPVHIDYRKQFGHTQSLGSSALAELIYTQPQSRSKKRRLAANNTRSRDISGMMASGSSSQTMKFSTGRYKKSTSSCKGKSSGWKRIFSKGRKCGKATASRSGKSKWITENGVRVYVKNGEKMAGQRAYASNSKDAGKSTATLKTQK